MTIPYRIGSGYDVHKFSSRSRSDATIMLGSVSVPHTHTVIAHSDGDVLIHALCDALLGALALGDIGRLFPDTDATYAGIDSSILLQEVIERVRAEGWELGNADITIIAQAPRVSPYVNLIQESLAMILKVENSAISIKATTTEKLGFTGRGEGIACQAQVLLYKNDKENLPR